MNPFSNLKSISSRDISFEIKDVDIAVINSLRRILLSEIPNVGFFFNPDDFSDDKDIKIIHNDSPLHNEFMQHRIALIPINVNTDELENWNDSEYSFRIEKTNNTNSLMSVYTSDFKVYDKNNVLQEKLASRWFPPDLISKDHILITKINPKDKSSLHIEAKATLGTPKISSSYGMISNCSIEFIVDETLADKELKKFLQTNLQSGTDENTLTREFNSLERERCYSRNKFREPNHFKMQLTSECAISPVYMISKAFDILKQKLLIIQNSDIEIVQEHNMFVFVIHGETHTIGNLFQALVFNHFIRTNNDNLTYIGYTTPHPLEEVILIKITGNNILSITDANQFFKNACDHVYSELDQLSKYWNTLSNY